MLLKIKKPVASAREAFIILSIILFLFSAAISLTVYIDSSYLKDAILNTPSLLKIKLFQNPDNIIGILYTLASLVTLIAFAGAPKILRKLGNYRFTLTLMILNALTLLGLGLGFSAWLIIPLFIFQAVIISILYFNFDIFLERYSNDAETGMIRGIFMTITSIAWLVPPFISGIIIDRFGGYPIVYLISLFVILPALPLLIRHFSEFKDLEYDDAPFLVPKSVGKKNPDIPRILWVSFFLQFFYAWMVIYAPLYFIEHLHISHEHFGLMMTVALLAFVFFPSPEGWLADKYIGEKELLITGFILMGLASFLIPLLASAPLGILGWAILLFLGRVGASTVDTMTQTYFFKQIDGHNASLVGYFSRSHAIAFVIAPLIATLLLQTEIIELSSLFTILGVFMFCAIYFPLRLKDTK